MGGWNSGRNNRGAGRCESWHRVELPYLRKHNFLSPGRRSTLTWHRGSERTGSIGFCAFENHAELRYSCDGESVMQRINYRYTSTNFGSRRMWFACPNCHRACGVLYGGRRFYCRRCWRLTYASQYEDWWERARSRAEKIRAKLGQPGFIDIDSTHDFPEKPKWMRWRTYRRLRAKDSQLMRAYEDGFCQMAMAFLHRHR
jgi:hypothetical protein